MDAPISPASNDSTKNAPLNGRANNRNKRNFTVITENNGRPTYIRKQRRTEYETAKHELFAGAREEQKFYTLIKDVDDEDNKRFTDLNYKERMTSIVEAIGKTLECASKIKMNRFKRFKDQFFSVQVGLDCIEDMNKLITVVELAGKKVAIKQNIGKNSVKGIVRDKEGSLKNMGNDEIMKAIDPSHNVVEIKRLGRSNTISINFMGQERPNKIKLWGMLMLDVEEHIPPPAKCFKCQQFTRHTGANCTNDYVCFKCGIPYKGRDDHDPKVCNKEAKCIHCGGRHWSGAMSCPETKKEVKWDKLVKETGKSRAEVKSRYPTGDRDTYCSAASNNFTFGSNINTDGNGGNNHFQFTNTNSATTAGVGADNEEDMESSVSENPAVKLILDRMQKLEDKLKPTEEIPAHKPEESKDRDWMKEQLETMREENTQNIQNLTIRLNEQATELTTLKDKVTNQEKVIANQRREMEEKDQLIQELQNENENLIVKTDQLVVNADKAITQENERLKAEVKKMKGEGETGYI